LSLDNSLNSFIDKNSSPIENSNKPKYGDDLDISNIQTLSNLSNFDKNNDPSTSILHEPSNAQSFSQSRPNIDNDNSQEMENDLKSYRVKNVGKIIIATLNINSIRNKLEQLKMLISGNIDVLVITETKLDDSFPT